MKNDPLSIFDFEWVVKQMGGKKEPAIKFITMFLAGLPEEIRQIQAAHDKQDWIAVKNITHKFHGGVSYCATTRLRDACRQLEIAINGGKIELFEGLCAQLFSEISLAEKTMREELAEWKI